MKAILSSGVAWAMKSSTPASLAIVAAVRGLSPVIITVRMPILRNSANRSTRPSLTVSLSSIMPRTRPSTRIASGVAPASAMRSAAATSSGGRPSRSAAIASTAPLRTSAPSVVRTPLVRVSARNGISSAMARSAAKPLSSPVPAGQPELGEPLAGQVDDRAALGVSSRIEATRAAVTASASVTPGAGVIDAARRLP